MKLCSSCRKKLLHLAKYCGYCGAKQQEHLICPICEYRNEGNSKFCQECGYSITNAEVEGLITPVVQTKDDKNREKEIIADGHDVITIEFVHSTSANFDFTLEEAKKFSTFEQNGEGKKARYKVKAKVTEIELLHPVVENLKGIRNKTVYLGETRIHWENIFAYKHCYEEKRQSYKPGLYCFGYENDWQYNFFGCIHSELYFTEYSKWWQWGRWLNRDGVWEFDISRIRHELQKNLFPYRFCPALNLRFVEAVLEVFPKTVNVFKDKEWTYIECWDDEKEGKISAKVKDRWGENRTIYILGAKPRNKNVLEKIVKEAKLKCKQIK